MAAPFLGGGIMAGLSDNKTQNISLRAKGMSYSEITVKWESKSLGRNGDTLSCVQFQTSSKAAGSIAMELIIRAPDKGRFFVSLALSERTFC